MVKHGNSKSFSNKFVCIRQYCQVAGISKTENIDVMIDYSKTYGFYATIISKEGKAMSKNENDCYKYLTHNRESIQNFKQWVFDRDRFYYDKK